MSVMTVSAIIISAVFVQSIMFCSFCAALLLMFCTMQYLLCENENFRLDYYEAVNEKYDILCQLRQQAEKIEKLKKQIKEKTK